jgi:cob(I)alamin adenosyltransferase
MAKIYTKTGDQGLTGLLSDRRISKDDVRIQAYGTVDELNATLGLSRAMGLDARADAIVAQLQSDLFVVGSALADPRPGGSFHASVDESLISRLETAIDAFDAELPPLTRFILPGGSPGASQLHLARTIARRAERWVVTLARTPGEDVPSNLIVYLNRLSDLLFVLARAVNQAAGVSDIPWEGL